MKASGGYIIHKQPLVRSSVHAHTAALEQPVSQMDLDALNTVQDTPWTINRRVLETLEALWLRIETQRLAGDLGLGREIRNVAGLRAAVKQPLPARCSDDAWTAMSDEDKKVHKGAAARIHSANASAAGREMALLDTLAVGRMLRDRAAFWYPHSRCFRGRLHPIPTSGPHPQGSDVQKGLIMFADGVALGPDGLFWLMVRAANCAGQDKLPLEERVQWVLDRKELIIETGKDPLGNPWWAEEDDRGDAKIDEPWSFLATCFELAQAFEMENYEDFVSHLPIPLDGTCNGLQHLSAMGLDPIGASATNLVAGQSRQDIYEEVANVVRRLVARDAATGNPAAVAWVGRVSRKTVKRAVMTTPYGVTDGGIRTQLMADGVCPDDGGIGSGEAASYLRDCLVTALSETVQSAKEIMLWLQTVAHRLADAGLPFDFTTPNGSQVRQAYYTIASNRVTTLCGRLRLDTEQPEAMLNPRKQHLASAPNVIHAWDAAHLARTVNLCRERGVTSFAMIHDSYGAHAGHTTTLSIALRETFIAIYQTDWLAEIGSVLQSKFPHVDLPDRPSRGSFDLGQIVDAEFFFS